jgi:ABC-type uncharacterized transport system substrate-binding protein
LAARQRGRSARAQQPATPVIGVLSGSSPTGRAHLVTAFRQGVREGGYTEGQNVAIEYRWAQDQYDRLPDLAADLVRSQVTVIGKQIEVLYASTGRDYAGRILKGEKPADLPVMQSINFEFVFNINTAKVFGLNFPPGLLAIADEVIE